MEFLSSLVNLPSDLPSWMPRATVGLMLLAGGLCVFLACRALRREGGKKEKKDFSEEL